MGVTMSQTVYPSFRNKRVVVTGGGSSIGAAIVETFVRARRAGRVHRHRREESRELERKLGSRRLPRHAITAAT